MPGEQRKAPRAPIEIKVEYRRLNAFIADYTRDLSHGGMFIETERPLASGDECLFTLHVPNLGDPISLMGVVRRVVEPGGHAPPGMGIELVFEDAAERDALRQVVDALMVEHLGTALYERMMRMRNRPGDQRASGGPQLGAGDEGKGG